MDLPARIGKYELLEFLGGGMSHVYRARDTVIGRTVADKILTEAGCQDPDAKARFLAEAQMAGNLTHDNVLSIYDFGEDEHRRPYMVMEFLRGESLAKAIEGGRTGDLHNKLHIALQLARALAHVHSQGIIHRDIKPENVQITSSGVVKLMDFGIAKTEGISRTQVGFVVGTPRFMAPEQVSGEGVTERADVYSFGILLFELVSGVNPIRGGTLAQIFHQILNEPIDFSPLRSCSAPQPLCDLIERSTRKNPAERPQSFPLISAELERIVEGMDAKTAIMPKPEPATLPPAPPAPPPPPRPRWLVPAIGALVLVLAVGLWFALRPKPAVQVPPGPEPPKKAELAKSIAARGGDMVLVPAGEFLFGKDKERVPLPAFYVDRTEVTNAAYTEFCSATGHALPPDLPRDQPALPVVNVSLSDAQAFAAWAGKRLPAASEWEKAARGADGRTYPWGEELDRSKANIASPALRPATDLPDGASPCGALNMVGNAWELVDGAVTPTAQTVASFRKVLTPAPTADEPWYAIRGLSFQDKWEGVERAVWDNATVPGRFAGPAIGFRCVKDAR